MSLVHALKTRAINFAAESAPALQTIRVHVIHARSPMNDPMRGLRSLQTEHARIHNTMQSMERMLYSMQADARLHQTVRSEKLKDLRQFHKCIKAYNRHHHEKERIIFQYAKRNRKVAVLEAMAEPENGPSCDDSDASLAHDALDNFCEAVRGVIDPNMTYIHTVKALQSEQDNRIFPAMEEHFEVAEMENISKRMDKIDHRNRHVINAMEHLSNALNQKYQT